MKKTKLKVDFNGSKQGFRIDITCDPAKRIYVLLLVRNGNTEGFYGATQLGDGEFWTTGPCWHRDWRILAYEYIDGEIIVVDEIVKKRYGIPHNFYLLGGESIETHFSWCNSIKEYCSKYQCIANVESEHADIISKSFPELNLYTDLPKSLLKPSYIGYNICKDDSYPNRLDWQAHRIDIQFYSWWNPRPPHDLTDKEIFNDIVYGPNYDDPFYDINRSPEQMIESLYLLDNFEAPPGFTPGN